MRCTMWGVLLGQAGSSRGEDGLEMSQDGVKGVA